MRKKCILLILVIGLHASFIVSMTLDHLTKNEASLVGAQGNKKSYGAVDDTISSVRSRSSSSDATVSWFGSCGNGAQSSLSNYTYDINGESKIDSNDMGAKINSVSEQSKQHAKKNGLCDFIFLSCFCFKK